MKIKSVIAKTLAVAMAFSLVAIAPDAEAAAKKPTIKKKVSVTVGKTKTVKVTSKKKVKKGTKWTLSKKKIVKLSAKKAKSVKVKGLKAGKVKLTAKVKVGKKSYKLKSTITVNPKSNSKTTTPPAATTPATTPTATTSGGGGDTNTPGGNPTNPPDGGGETFTTSDGKTLTIADTYEIPLTELNEATITSEEKHGSSPYTDGSFNRDGSVSFTATSDYNSGMAFYVNPCTSDDQLEEDGSNLVYNDCDMDVTGYDYIRIKVTSDGELNCRLYDSPSNINGSAGYPGTQTDVYEGGWIGPVATDDYMEPADDLAGRLIKPGYEERTLYIPLSSVAANTNLATLSAIAIGLQRESIEATIHSIELVKVKYDTLITEITLTSNKAEVENNRTATLTAAINPADASKKWALKWSSNNEELAKVNFAGIVTAAAEGTGTVTITAEALDGSGVKGTIDLKIVGAGEPIVTTTQEVDFTNANVVTTAGATKTAGDIVFPAGTSQCFVDLSKYLEEKGIELADYSALDVMFEVRDASGAAIADWGDETDIPGYGKVAWVAQGDLNGWKDDANCGGPLYTTAPHIGETKILSLTDLDAAAKATIAGFNLQLEKIPATYSIAVTKIIIEA